MFVDFGGFTDLGESKLSLDVGGGTSDPPTNVTFRPKLGQKNSSTGEQC